MSRLLEREREVTLVRGAMASARRGQGTITAVLGAPGTGRTSLLAAARTAGERAGMLSLSSACTPLEREFPLGLVRRLLEPAAGALPQRRRAALLAALEARDEDGEAPGYEALDALRTAVDALAEAKPALITIDDAEAADPPSLRFLAFLGARIRAHRIALIVSAPPPGLGPQAPLLDALLDAPGVACVTLEDLGDEATATLLSERIGTPVEPGFAAACRRATGGNPRLLTEVAAAARAEDIAPASGSAGRVAELAPAAIAGRLLAGLPPEATAVARAQAVLGDGAELHDVARLAALKIDVAGAAADALVRAGVLRPRRPLGFAQPIVAAAIIGTMAPHERSEQHAGAARLLAGRGDAERVAEHLLAAGPAGDPWAVAQLELAAGDAMREGAEEFAHMCLVRALAEPPAAGDLPRVLRAAGRSGSRTGSPGAWKLLSEAFELESDPARRAEIGFELAQTLALGGRPGRAAALLLRALDSPQIDGELRAGLEALLCSLAATTTSGRRVAGDRLARAAQRDDLGDPARGALLAPLALEQAVGGGSAAEAASLATRALADSRVIRDSAPGSLLPYIAAGALLWADRTELAHELVTGALAAARARGSSHAAAFALAARGAIRLRRGELTGAEADARAALAIELPEGGSAIELLAASTLAGALSERGYIGPAEKALAVPGSIMHDPDTILAQPLREARARLALARGEPSAALETLRACEAREISWGVRAVVPVAWRSEAAVAHAACGRAAEARRLATEELELARLFGAPRAVGVALRTLAQVSGPRSRTVALELLREAVETLEASGDRLERARATVELGAALRRAGSRSEARERLTLGLEEARGCGATPLVDRAYAELAASGVRRRKILRAGISELTASERRVAELAAQGMSNREIAEALVVTAKTIETHLGRVYRKLEIRSRKQLAGALESREPEAA